MPNRIIKESICTSDTVDGLTWFEEVFFYRLTVNCDDYGRFDARPAILKARLFPLKDIREEQIVKALNKLSLVGIVELYECDQRPYLQLSTWANHQQIRNKKSKYPENDNACNKLQSIDFKCNQAKSDVTVIQSNPNPNPNPRIVGNPADDDLKFKIDSFEILCVNKIINSCLEGFPNSKVPDTLEKKQKWAIEIDRMKRIDNLTEDEISQILDYAINDSFWQSNIRSTSKLREKYETLYMQLKNKKAATNTGGQKPNKFHNFDQRDTNYDALVMNQVQSWLGAEGGINDE